MYLREYDISEEEFQRRKEHRRTLETTFFRSVSDIEQLKKPKRKSAPPSSAASSEQGSSVVTRQADPPPPLAQPGVASISPQVSGHLETSGAAQRPSPSASASLLSQLGNLSSAQSLLPGNPLFTSASSSTLQRLAGLHSFAGQAGISNRLSQTSSLQPELNPLQLSLGTLPLNSRMISGLGSNPSLTAGFAGNSGLQVPHVASGSLSSLSPLEAARLQLLRSSYGSTSGITASQLVATRQVAAMSSAGPPPRMSTLLSSLAAGNSLRRHSVLAPTLEQQILAQNATLSRAPSSLPIESAARQASPVARPDQQSNKRKRGPKEESDDSKRRAS